MPKNKELIKQAVSVKVGTGPEQLYLVTDPECPFCRRLEENIDPEAKKKYTLNVILFPLPFHADAKPMSRYILAGKDNEERAKRLHDVMTGSEGWKEFKVPESQKEEIEAKIKKGLDAANELRAGGTPTLFDAYFSPVDVGLIAKKQPAPSK